MMLEDTKSFPITVEQVWAGYLEVRKHGKSAGVDKLTMRDYDAVKSDELYKVWNRMASGSYFPPPVRQAETEKTVNPLRAIIKNTYSETCALVRSKIVNCPKPIQQLRNRNARIIIRSQQLSTASGDPTNQFDNPPPESPYHGPTLQLSTVQLLVTIN